MRIPKTPPIRPPISPSFQVLIDLNKTPPHPNDPNPIPVIVSVDSPRILLLDLNTNANPNWEQPVLELDIDEFAEEAEEEESNDNDIEEETAEDNIIEATETTVVLHEYPGKKRKMATNDRRREIVDAILMKCVNGKVRRNTLKEVAADYGLHLRSVQRMWKQVKNTAPGAPLDIKHKKTGRCGRPRKFIDLSEVIKVPLLQRTTLTSLAEALGVAYATLFRCLKKGLIKRHSNSIKPHLSKENKIGRLKFCLSMLDDTCLPNVPKFKSMYDQIHIDEKWFYMTKRSETFYLLPSEEDPLRTCQSKNFIGKVMFLAAVARPRFDSAGNTLFSGKLGIFPFVTMQPAKRSSKNREAGTLEMKAINSVKRENIKDCLINDVLPSIKLKWPEEDSRKPIFIQQDNARTHVSPSDVDFQAAALEDGFDIHLMCQPPNSPDLNVLDTGFFRAIQSLQQKMRATTVEQLVGAVQLAYDKYSPKKLNRVFLTYQCCMKETMKLQGSNRFRIPHIKKGQLEREGRLLIQITCDPMIVQSCKDFLASELVQVLNPSM